MKELARNSLVGFAAGVLGAILVLWFSGSDDPRAKQASPGEDQISELLSRVAMLEEQLADKSASIAAIPLPNAGSESGEAGRSAAARAALSASGQSADVQMAGFLRNQQNRTSDQLRAIGWSDAEIRSLDEMKIAASLEMERRMYEEMRKSIDENPSAMDGWGQLHTIRDSLGEERYEQYRVAVGKPTAVTVHTILVGSAGDAAGLKQGDLIRRYGSDRVYSDQDLMMSVLRGKPGEAVTIEIERDGAVFHVTVPRGPLGTSQIARMMIDN